MSFVRVGSASVGIASVSRQPRFAERHCHVGRALALSQSIRVDKLIGADRRVVGPCRDSSTAVRVDDEGRRDARTPSVASFLDPLLDLFGEGSEGDAVGLLRCDMPECMICHQARWPTITAAGAKTASTDRGRRTSSLRGRGRRSQPRSVGAIGGSWPFLIFLKSFEVLLYEIMSWLSSIRARCGAPRGTRCG